MISSVKHGSLCYWLCLGVLAVGILLRFLHLDADPEYYEWVGYITDEGRWVQYARSLAIDGTVHRSFVGDLHLFLAPLFQLTNYLVFQLAGVSLLTSRVFTAVCGSALIVLFWACLRRVVSLNALLLGVTMLAVQTDLVVFSRVAVPEMVVLSIQLLIFFVIIGNAKASQRMIFAGFLMLVAAAMKATILFMLPINLAIIYFMPRNSIESRRLRDVGMFVTGFTFPLVLGFIGGYFVYSDWTPVWLNFIPKIHLEIKKLLVPTDLFAVISFPFNHSLSSLLNLWSLGPWLTILAWRTSGPNDSDIALRRLLGSSAIWCLLYFPLMVSLNYFPSRYQLHILIPMALVTTAGISLMQKIGLQRITEFLALKKGLWGHLWLAFLCFPTAVFLAPLLAWIAVLLGFDSDRLLTKFGCLILFFLVIAYLAQTSRHDQRAMAYILFFPIVEGMVWIASFTFGDSGSFWPTIEWRFWIGSFMIKTIIGLALSAFCVFYLRGSPLAEGSRAIAVFAILYLALFLIKDAPGYLSPRYSMKESSRDIGVLLSGYSSIASLKAEAMFSENRLHYKSIGRSGWYYEGWFHERPEILVVAFNDAKRTKLLETHYNLLKNYTIHVSPEYYRWNPNLKWNLGTGVVVSVYGRKRN